MSELPHESKTDTTKNGLSPAIFTPGAPEPLGRSNAKRNVLIISFVVVLITAAVAATLILEKNNFPGISHFIQKVRNSQTSSEDSVKHVVESLFSIKTADVQIDLETSGPMFASTTKVKSQVMGRFDPKGSENGSYELAYEIKEANNNTFAPTAFYLTNVASNTYFRATGLPNIFLISDALNGNWIDLSQNVQNANFHYPALNKNDIAASLVDNHVFSISKDLGSEKFDDVMTNHFSVNVDRDGFRNFAKSFFRDINATLTDEQIQKIVDSLHFERLEVWVGQNDFFPHKITVDITVTKNSDVHIEDGTLSATIFFSKLNETKAISAPKNAMTLPQALTPQLQGFVGGLFDKALGTIFQQFPQVNGLPDTDGDGVNDASEVILGTDPTKKDSNNNGVSDKEELSSKLGDSRDADDDGLSDTLEGIFGTDPKKGDTDGDGFQDGEEVINGFNPKGTGKLFP